jgi:hypothetical protein
MLGIVDDGEGGEQIPDAAPARGGEAAALPRLVNIT